MSNFARSMPYLNRAHLELAKAPLARKVHISALQTTPHPIVGSIALSDTTPRTTRMPRVMILNMARVTRRRLHLTTIAMNCNKCKIPWMWTMTLQVSQAAASIVSTSSALHLKTRSPSEYNESSSQPCSSRGLHPAVTYIY